MILETCFADVISFDALSEVVIGNVCSVEVERSSVIEDVVSCLNDVLPSEDPIAVVTCDVCSSESEGSSVDVIWETCSEVFTFDVLVIVGEVMLSV